MEGVQPQSSAAKVMGDNSSPGQVGREIAPPATPEPIKATPKVGSHYGTGKKVIGNLASKKHQRINSLNAVSLVVMAVIFDLISLIPVVNIVSGMIAYVIFGLWFYLLGVGFMNPKRFATAAVSALIGFIPVLSMLPELTVAVIVVILMVKSEDKLGIKLPSIGTKPK